MQSVFVDRSGDNAPNQALALMDSVVEMKRAAIAALGKHELLEGFTVDTPVPYNLDDLVKSLIRKMKKLFQLGKNTSLGRRRGSLRLKRSIERQTLSIPHSVEDKNE